MTTMRSSTDAISLDVELAASPVEVFEALTDPVQLAAWWGTAGQPVRWEVDLRVGGRWRATGRDESCGDWVVSGEIVELDPPWTLVLSWSERSEAKQLEGTLVRYLLEPTTEGTRLKLTHSGFGNALQARDEYQGGWPGLLTRLRHYLGLQA